MGLVTFTDSPEEMGADLEAAVCGSRKKRAVGEAGNSDRSNCSLVFSRARSHFHFMSVRSTGLTRTRSLIYSIRVVLYPFPTRPQANLAPFPLTHCCSLYWILWYVVTSKDSNRSMHSRIYLSLRRILNFRSSIGRSSHTLREDNVTIVLT